MNNQHLKTGDKKVFDIIQEELNRQRSKLEMIASENIVSYAVMRDILRNDIMAVANMWISWNNWLSIGPKSYFMQNMSMYSLTQAHRRILRFITHYFVRETRFSG